YSRLPAKAAAVFRMLSIFPADFDFMAEEAICQDEDHEQLSELLRWNLVDYRDETKRYRLHDLVRIFASGRFSEVDGEGAKNEARQRHAEHFRNVLSFATDLYEKGNVLTGLNAFDLEKMNIESAWAWAKENLAKSDAAASICSYFLNWPYLLDLRQHPRERISWTETALSAARKLNDRSAEGVHLGNLGLAYANLGDARKAIEYYEQALAIARKIGDRRGEDTHLGNLGSAHYVLGDARKATEYYEKALIIDREIGDRRGEGADLGNLGSAHYVLGDARKAIEHYEQALAILSEIGDRRGEGACLGNLGSAYGTLGDTHKAIDYYEQRISIAREIGDRRGEATASWNLGLQYKMAGDLKRAAELMQICVSFEREIGHPDAEKHAAGLQAIHAQLKS
ncbi:MAG: tetratricopeptide repeat protein, partial [Methanothrix sp.]|nr:tetratricopeptide repeat protein [Methanothrix sp.]